MPAHELVNPNLHVVLVHFPIALLVVGTLIEVFSFLGWRTSGFRIAGRWMIGLGALLAIPTAFSGIYALSDVVRMSNPAPLDSTWNQTLATSPVAQNPEAWAMLQRHGFLNAGVVALLGLVVVVWLSGSDEWRRKMHLPLVVLLIVGVGAAGLSAWYGGEIVYRKGVGVMEGQAMATVSPASAPRGGSTIEEKLEKATTNPAVLSPATVPASGLSAGNRAITDEFPVARDKVPTTSPAAAEQTDVKRHIERVFPPLQMHVILAGFAVAFALAAVGLSLRAANVARVVAEEPVDEFSDLAAAYGAMPVRPGRPDAIPTRVTVIDRSRVPSARFWLLTALFAVLTATLGWWLIIQYEGVQNVFNFMGLWNEHLRPYPRRMFHAIAGGAIVVLSLLLALLAGMAPRARGIILLLSVLLIAVVAAQVWMGMLMLWDTHDGPIRAFNA